MLNRKTLLPLLILAFTALSCRLTSPAPTSTPPFYANTSTAAGATAIPETPVADVYDWSALDAALESFVPSTVNGLTFLLAKDGQIVYEKELGNQKMDSFLPIASSTKMPSAVVVLTLVEDGLLDLDEPIGTYLQGHINLPADNGSPTWDLISTLTIPAESAYGVIGSPEASIAGGKSYITLVVKENANYAPAEVWVWGVENENRFTLQCQDGQGNLIRTDPETYLGANQVFVYYNTLGDNQRFELFRCETGIKP